MMLKREFTAIFIIVLTVTALMQHEHKCTFVVDSCHDVE